MSHRSLLATWLHPRVVIVSVVLTLLVLGLSVEDALAACSATLVATTATFTCDGTNDSTVFDQSGGLLRHDRPLGEGFADAFDFDSVAVGSNHLLANGASTVNFNLGAGQDQLVLGTATVPASTLLAAFNVNNLGNDADLLLIRDTASAVANNITIDATQVTGTGINVTRTGAGFGSGVVVETGTAGDTVRIRGQHPAGETEPTVVIPTNNDSVIIGSSGNSLNGFVQVVQVAAAAHVNAAVTVQDQGTVGVDHTYTFTSTGVTRVVDGVNIVVGDIGTLELQASQGNDTINVQSTRAGLLSSVIGGQGNDTFVVRALASATLDGLASPIFISGVNGTDTVTIDDSADTDANTYDLSAGALSRNGASVVQADATVEQALLRLGAGPTNTVTVNTSPTTLTDVVGNVGADTLTFITNGGNLGGGGFDGGGGTDTLSYTGYTTPVTVNLAAGTATGLANVVRVENLVGGAAADSLTGDDGPNVITGGPQDDTMHGGLGNDRFIWNAGDGDDDIFGEGDADTLEMNGRNVGAPDDFIIHQGGALGMQINAGGGLLNFSTVEALIVNLLDGDDEVLLQSTVPGLAVTVNGGAGNDTLNLDTDPAVNAGTVKFIQGPVVFDGGAGTNNVVNIVDIDTVADTVVNVTPTQVGAAAGNNLFSPGVALTYSNVNLLSLILGSGNDTARVVPSATTAFTLNGGPQPTADILDLDLTGVTSPHLTGTAANGSLTSANRQTVTFSQFETLLVNGANPFGALAFSAPTFNVGEAAGTATITVVRTGATLGTVSATASTSDGSATQPSDYTLTNTSVSFLENETSKTFTVPIVNDALVEGNETVNLALSNPQGGATLGAQATAVLTIVEDDTPPAGALSFSAPNFTVAEGGISATITVVRTGGTFGAVSATASTSVGTANTPADFGQVTTTVSFGNNETSKSFTVPIAQDALVEGNETVNLALSNPQGGATLGAQSTAVLTIVDDDQPAAGALSFSAPTYTVNEGGNLATIALVRTGATTGTVSVTASTSNGTAGAPADFALVTASVTFGDGENVKTFTVPIVNDALVEGNETVNLALSNPLGGATLGAQATAVLTIVDDDVAGDVPPEIKSDDDQDDDKADRKHESDDERRRRKQTNAGGEDDVRLEGNVVEVHQNQTPRYFLVGTLDGTAKVVERCSGGCTTVHVGDYVIVKGEKEHELLFYADEVSID
jgi:hypothetical protein